MDVNPLRSGINLLGDAHHLPLRDKSVCGLLCRSVLEHVDSPIKALYEMKRVTDGLIVIRVPNVMNFWRIYMTLRNPEYPIPPITRHLQSWDSKSIRYLMRVVGLSIVRLTWTGHLLFAKKMIVIVRDESQ